MSLTGSIVSLAAVAGAAVIGFSAIDVDTIKADTQVVADAATCHTLSGAAAGYYAEYDAVAPDIAALAPYVSAPDGTVARYALVNGIVVGPGCPE